MKKIDEMIEIITTISTGLNIPKTTVAIVMLLIVLFMTINGCSFVNNGSQTLKLSAPDVIHARVAKEYDDAMSTKEEDSGYVTDILP